MDPFYAYVSAPPGFSFQYLLIGNMFYKSLCFLVISTPQHTDHIPSRIISITLTCKYAACNGMLLVYCVVIQGTV
jgi:hypothetical protein